MFHRLSLCINMESYDVNKNKLVDYQNLHGIRALIRLKKLQIGSLQRF